MTILVPFLVLLLAYGLVSARLERTSLTPPIVFTAAGFALGLAVPSLRERHGDPELVLRIAEIGLVFLLFLFAHGLSAKRGIDAYAASLGTLAPDAPEREAAGMEGPRVPGPAG